MWNEQDWQALAEHARRCRQQPIAALIAAEPGRNAEFARRLGPLYCNFARQHLDVSALADMQRRIKDSGIQTQVRELFDGARINRSEDRAVLHTALRSNFGNSPEAQADAAELIGNDVVADAAFDGAEAHHHWLLGQILPARHDGLCAGDDFSGGHDRINAAPGA